MDVSKQKNLSKPQRIDLRRLLCFSSGEIKGEAHITNILAGGCRADSQTNVAEGLAFLVLLNLPGRANPVKIQRASVRRLKGRRSV